MDGGGYSSELNQTLGRVLKGRNALACVRATAAGLMNDDVDLAGISRLIFLQLAAMQHDARRCASA